MTEAALNISGYLSLILMNKMHKNWKQATYFPGIHRTRLAISMYPRDLAKNSNIVLSPSSNNL